MRACVSEGEQEEQWLADAGLSNLISEDSEDVDNVLLLSTLTRAQAEAVQRRLDSYTLTLRKKNKPPPRDVRDIFNSPISQVSAGRAASSGVRTLRYIFGPRYSCCLLSGFQFGK